MSNPSQRAIYKSKKAQNEEIVFQQKLRLKSNTGDKILCLGAGNLVFDETMKDRDQYTSISTLRIGLRCHMRTTPAERVVQVQISFTEKQCVVGFFGG